ncbi:MAG: response regulator [Gemmatimonadaceae bacterium]
MKVLIVDDDPVIAAIVKVVLGSSGYSIDHASDGVSGLALALSGAYDGMILDLGLGDVSGEVVLRELRQSGCNTPVLILTADSSDETMRKVLDAGADQHVVKPIQPGELIAQTRALVRCRKRISAAFAL